MKRQTKPKLKAFLCGQQVCTLLQTGFGESLVVQRGAQQLAMGRGRMANVAPHTNRKLYALAPGYTGST